jgi:hypothetical protein
LSLTSYKWEKENRENAHRKISKSILYSLALVFSEVVAFVSCDESIAFDNVIAPISVGQQGHFVCLNVLTTLEPRVLNEFVENISNYREDHWFAYDTLFNGI